MTFESDGIVGKQGVDETKELHDTFVLSEIFVSLQQEHEFGTIASF